MYEIRFKKCIYLDLIINKWKNNTKFKYYYNLYILKDAITTNKQ